MQKIIVSLILLLGVFAPFAQTQQRGMTPIEAPESNARTALVIGNGAYGDASLKNAVEDSRTMVQTLRSVGFTVNSYENVDRRKMIDAVLEFGGKIQKDGGAGLFYYAGHGIQVDGRNFLIPIGANIDKKQDIEYEAVDVGRILGEMDAAHNSVNIVILDACRDNPFARNWRSTTEGRGLAFMNAPSGTFMCYATAPGEVASDELSYTQELVKNIATPGLTIEQVVKRAGAAIQQQSNGRQIPWFSSNITGDFYFVPPKEDILPKVPGTKTLTVPSNNRVPYLKGMVFVEGGAFQRGSPNGVGFNNEHRQDSVTLSDFYMDKYEVTQAEYEKVMGKNPSYFKCSTCPVENVSSNDAAEYAKKMGKRLPTEAEWEYAARGGKLSKRYNFSGSDNIDDVGWYDGNSGTKTHPVGEKAANELGIYDMSGNVWEWCADWYDSSYYSASPFRNPPGPEKGSNRVLRGGSWTSTDNRCRVTNRSNNLPNVRVSNNGFRCAKTP